jgi:putative ABC transport system permease protein
MVAGIGLNLIAVESARASLQSLGTDVVILSTSLDSNTPEAVADTAVERLLDAPLIQQVALVGVAHKVPTLSASVYGARLPATIPTTVLTISGDVSDVLGLSLRAGRFLNAVDADDALPVAVLGETAADYFGVQSPGALLMVGDSMFMAVGILNSSPILRDLDTSVLITPEGAESLGGSLHPTRIVAKVEGGRADDAARLLPIAMTLGSGPQPRATVVGRLGEAERVVGQSFARLGTGIGVLVLLFSMLIIGTTMHRTVTERTPEIGMRVAIGHPMPAVAAQMLFESLIAAAAGALVGAIVALAGLRIQAASSGVTYEVDWSLVGASVFVTVSTSGLASWAALRRVRRIDPLDAIRME